MKKKALSLLLVLVMVLSMLPVSSLATGLWGNLELSENLTAEAEEITLSGEKATGLTQPFPSGTLDSRYFRIPAIVTLNDGAVVAAADARWNSSADGGGIDTIVSISKDNGATWTSSFANYLADNNKAYKTNSATFIDPALASDGTKLYMLVDLFPAGYSNLGYSFSSDFDLQSTGNGFDSQGRLIISKGTGARSTTTGGYYLGEFGDDGFASIYNTSDAKVAGYKVDRWFNLYKDDSQVSNLYYYGADYQAFPVQYLYLTESTDGGQTWSAPKLLNLKQNGEVFCGVCPGSGYVTSTGRIIFLVYDCARIFGSMQTSVVYSDDQGKTWHRGATIGTDGQMSEATLSEVYLNGKYYLYALGRGNNSYFVSSDDGETWSTATSTGLSYQTGSAMGSITYSKLIDGCPAIILSAPSGSSNRTAGKLYVGLVQSDRTIDWEYTYAVNSSSYYAYSDLIELPNGSIGLLYESDSAAITFKELTISEIAPGATIGEAAFPKNETVNDQTTGITVTAPGLTSVSVEKKENVTIEGAETVLAYDITPRTASGNYTGEASVTFTLPEEWINSARIKGFVENSSGGFDTLTAAVANGVATVTFPHFSVGGVYYEAVQNNVGSDAATQEQLTLTVGEKSKVYTIPGDYSSYNGQKTVDGIATISAVKKTSAASVVYEPAEFENGTFYLSTQSSNPTDLVEVTIEDYADGTCYVKQGSSYVYPNASYSWFSWSYNANTEDSKNTPVTVTVNSDGSVKLTRSVSQTIITTPTTGLTVSDNALSAKESGDNLYLYTAREVPAGDYTEITFTAIAGGKASTTIGTTTFDITVNKQTKTVNLKPGDSTTIENAGTTIETYPDSAVATASLSGTTLTITGVADGNTTMETDTYVITINVSTIIEGLHSLVSANNEGKDNFSDNSSNSAGFGDVIAAGDMVTGLMLSYSTVSNGTTSFTLKCGDSNASIANVSISGDSVITTSIEDGNLTITGSGTGSCELTVIFSDGSQTTIPVRVVDGTNSISDENTFVIYVDATYNTELYTAVASGNTKDLQWQYLPVGYAMKLRLKGGYGGRESVVLFSARPVSDQYALNYIGQSINYTENTLTAGSYHFIGRNEDGTSYGHDPSVTSANSAVYYYDYLYYKGGAFNQPSSSTSYAYTQSEFQSLLLDGVKKDLTAGFMYSTAVNVRFQVIADRLPTFEKVITSVTKKDNTTVYPDAEGNIGKIELGDTINYEVKVTSYKPHSTTYTSTSSSTSLFGSIEYPSATWNDAMTDVSNKSITIPKSETSAGTIREVPGEVVQQTTTASTSFKLTMQNFDWVKDNVLTNKATLDYSYKAKYASGTASAAADASAECIITTPTFVVDFGLNVDLDLKNVLGDVVISNATSTNSNIVSSNGQILTYSASNTLPDRGDYIDLDLAGNLHYGITIIPASNVLYEENFFTAGNGWAKAGMTPNSKQQTQQVGANGTYYVFGRDAAYDSATGAQGYYEATGLKPDAITGQLTTSFYGNAFDLIGSCGSNTGRVLMLISGNSKNYIYDVDTRYNDGKNTTLNQVPLAHAELGTDANYTVKICAAGLDATTASGNANAASTFSVSGSADALTLFLAENDLTAAEVEIISVTPDLVAYASAVSVNDLAEATAVSHAEGTHVEIDAFRVYRSSNNANYPTAEQKKVYKNVLDVVDATTQNVYTENGVIDFTTGEAYQNAGGPQNELYLLPGQSVTFGALGNGTVQISLRAVSATPVTYNYGDGKSGTLSSNVEMYYTIEPTSQGVYTIANPQSSTGMLAIGNVKVADGTIIQTAQELGHDIVVQSIRTVLASAPVETEPEYDPFVDVKLRATSLLRKKLVTLTITTSTDVETLTVNGYKLNPVNKWMVQTGRATTYTYILADTVSKNTTKTYEITAVNANGQSCTVTKQA